jgi:hypothetical protein
MPIRGSPNRNGDANHKESPNRFGDPQTDSGTHTKTGIPELVWGFVQSLTRIGLGFVPICRLVKMNKRLDVATAETVPITSRIHLSGLNCIEIKPSDIMKDHAKVELLFSIFDANGKLSFSEWHGAMADANMFAEVLKKADLLFVMLSSRFQTHVKRKVKVCQQSNRCLA